MYPHGMAHWRHVANTTEPSVCDGDAVLRQITLTTCSFYCCSFSHLSWRPTLWAVQRISAGSWPSPQWARPRETHPCRWRGDAEVSAVFPCTARCTPQNWTHTQTHKHPRRWLWSPAIHILNTPFTRYNRLWNRLYNRFDIRLYRVNKHPTGCQTGLTTVCIV